MAGGMHASVSQAPLGGNGKFSNESTEDRSGVSIHVARLSPFARARFTNAMAVTSVRERVRVVGTSTRAVACAFASEPQPSPTLQKHRSKAAEQQHGIQK